jgi:threonylcarbamoyladenosine tRNA methylthiotransferase MtaB
MPDQVPEKVKGERSHCLLEAEKRMSRAYRERKLGTGQNLLLEEPMEIGGVRYMTGFTPEYVRAAVITEKGAGETVSGIFSAFLTEEILLMEVK